MRNRTKPSCRAPLRPNRSPIEPVENSRPAKTSEYTATTHWSSAPLACSARASVGRVTLRLELPTKTMTMLRHSTASVHQRRSNAVDEAGEGVAFMAVLPGTGSGGRPQAAG